MSDRSLLSTTNSGVGTLTLRTETLIRPKVLKHSFKVGCCGAQALHNSKEGSRGTQALHNDRIPGTLTTRILEGGRRTLTLHIGKEEGHRGTQALHNDEWGVVELKHCTTSGSRGLSLHGSNMHVAELKHCATGTRTWGLSHFARRS